MNDSYVQCMERILDAATTHAFVVTGDVNSPDYNEFLKAWNVFYTEMERERIDHICYVEKIPF